MPASPDREDGLVAILRRYHRRYQPLERPRALNGAGGRSGSRLWRWSAEAGEVLLRGWPEGVTGARVRLIHGWLGAARGCSFVPCPIPDEGGATWWEWDGRVWQLEPWMAGSARTVRAWGLPHVAAAFGGLRRLHDELGVESRFGSSPAVRRRLEEIRELLDGGMERLGSAVGNWAGPEGAAARVWLGAARERLKEAAAGLAAVEGLTVRLQPCVRDCRIEHFLFDGERLTGLVDFGAMDIEAPWVDLARLFVDLDDGPRRRLALEAYGRTDEGLRLLEPLRVSAEVLIGAHWIRWAFVEGRRFASGEVLAGLRYGLERLLSPRG